MLEDEKTRKIEKKPDLQTTLQRIVTQDIPPPPSPPITSERSSTVDISKAPYSRSNTQLSSQVLPAEAVKTVPSFDSIAADVESITVEYLPLIEFDPSVQEYEEQVARSPIKTLPRHVLREKLDYLLENGAPKMAARRSRVISTYLDDIPEPPQITELDSPKAPSKTRFSVFDMNQKLPNQMVPTEGYPLDAGDLIDDTSKSSLSSFSTIAAMLRLRASSHPKAVALSILDSRGKDSGVSITFEKLNGRAERVAQLLKEKRIRNGEPVVLLYKSTELIEYVVAMFGCFYAGVAVIPFVPLSFTEEMSHLIFMLNQSGSKFILSTDPTIKVLQKDINNRKMKPQPNPADNWPEDIEIIRTNDLGVYQKKKGIEEMINCNPSNVAVIEYSKSLIGEYKGTVISHAVLLKQCYNYKYYFDIKSTDVILGTMDSRISVGLTFNILMPIYCCCGSFVIGASDPNGTIVSHVIPTISRWRVTLFVSDQSYVDRYVKEYKVFAEKNKKLKPYDLSGYLRACPTVVTKCESSVLLAFNVILKQYKAIYDDIVCPFAISAEIGNACFAITPSRRHDGTVWECNSKIIPMSFSKSEIRKNRISMDATGLCIGSSGIIPADGKLITLI
jgi:hypothetical protein